MRKYAMAFAMALLVLPTTICRAQSSTSKESMLDSLDNAPGLYITPSNFKQYITTDRPYVVNDRSLLDKIFLIYNVGQRKFLNIGGWWGSHAELSDTPRLFWIQRRNEKKETYNHEVRYPEKDTTLVFPSVIEKLYDLKTARVGSMEGDGRSSAKYNYIRKKAKDGTITNLVDVNTITSGAKFQSDEFSIDFNNGDAIEAEINLSTCKFIDYKTPENVFSFGNAIKDWGNQSGQYNLHLYYYPKGISSKQPTDRLEIAYVDKDNGGGIKMYFDNIKTEYDSKLTLTLSKDKGLYINGKYFAASLVVNYNKDKIGDIVRFTKDASTGNDVLDDNGSERINHTYNDYVYAYESKSDNDQTYFLSSRVLKTYASNNEGEFLGFTPWSLSGKQRRDADVGVFVDRSISNWRREVAQWSIDYPENNANKGECYLSLTMKFNEQGDTTKNEQGEVVQHTYYLQASQDYITGAEPKDFNNMTASEIQHYYYMTDTKHNGTFQDDLVSVDVTSTEPKSDKNGRWKIIPLRSVIGIVGNLKEMLVQSDLTFLLNDPDFGRENADLANWKNEQGLEGKMIIGYDNYYKTSPSDKKYTNAGGENLRNNHGRYMATKIYNGGRGKFYQEMQVFYPGWYAITCQGMTNIGAKLFVQRRDSVNSMVSVALTKVTDSEIAKFNCKEADAFWPYSGNMPLYNASVAMNDAHIEPNFVSKYKNQVMIYIENGDDGNTLCSPENPTTLQLGINVLDNENSEESIKEYDEFTVFDNFHLLFGGSSEEPNLVLNEDFTNLDYIDDCQHIYTKRTMRLYRTFNANHWNTIVLPVELNKEQFENMFGTNARLAYLKEIKDDVIRFYTVEREENGVFLRAFMPYIIKPEFAQGNQPTYTATLTKKDGTEMQVTAPDNHFVAYGITLTPLEQEGGIPYYDFKEEYNNMIDGISYLYTTTGVTNNYGIATDGKGNRLVNYGTLCKTYEGRNILVNRNDLSGGKSYYLSQNTLYRVPEGQQYGLKGFRGWFKYYPASTTSTSKQFKIGIDDVIETGIGMIENDDNASYVGRFRDGVYNLQGQRVGDANTLKQLPAGIYILNGKKYVIGK